MPPICKRICLHKHLLISIMIFTVMALASSEARAQTGSNGNDGNEPENQVVLAMDAANYGSADLALFFLVLERWFPNPVIDSGYRGAAGTYHFHLNKGSSAELWLVPVESINPNDGTVSLGWNIWSDDGGLLIDGTVTNYSAPISGNSGDLGIHTYMLAAPKVDIVNADVTTDTIQLCLEPRGVSGTLTLELIDPDSHIIRSEVRVGSTGTLTETFDINNLAVGEYQKVKATWDVGGVTAEDKFDYHIKVLGMYNHTRYNTPTEEFCSGSNMTFSYIDGPGFDCRVVECEEEYWHEGTALSEWLLEVEQNGSGYSSTLGYVTIEGFCSRPGATYRFRKVPHPCPKCGGTLTVNSSVAVQPNHPDLPCGAEVYVDTIGMVTVQDIGGGVQREQLDHYAGTSGCNSEGGSIGQRMTIRIF